jgi:hypothetical protein
MLKPLLFWIGHSSMLIHAHLFIKWEIKNEPDDFYSLNELRFKTITPFPIPCVSNEKLFSIILVSRQQPVLHPI